MTALAIALAYLGTLATLCWFAWHRERRNLTVAAVLEQVVGAMEDLDKRSEAWDEAAGDVETLKLQAGLKPRERKATN